MNAIEEKYKQYCYELLPEIQDQELQVDFFFYETFNDTRLCYRDPITNYAVPLHTAHSYQSIYVFLLGILYATDLCRHYAKFSIFEELNNLPKKDLPKKGE